LSQVRIASPCSESWENMTGSEQVRFCGRCEKRVYNLSAMPAEEAEALLSRKRFGVCIQLAKRADGTLVTSDCPVGAKRSQRTTALAVASLLVTAAGCDQEQQPVAEATQSVASEPPSPTPGPSPEELLEREERELEKEWEQRGGMLAPPLPNLACPPRWKLGKGGKKIRVKQSTSSELQCRPPRGQPGPSDHCDPRDPLCGL
jgi:hypothetical protein